MPSLLSALPAEVSSMLDCCAFLLAWQVSRTHLVCTTVLGVAANGSLVIDRRDFTSSTWSDASCPHVLNLLNRAQTMLKLAQNMPCSVMFGCV